MIWYRHWLELRSTAGMLMAGAVVLGPLYFRSELLDPRPALQPNFMLAPLQGLTQSLDTLQITAIARHIEFTWFAILAASLFLAGDGLRVISQYSQSAAPGPGNAQFTLSLPLSRRCVVTTRIAAGYLTAAIGLAMSVAANAIAVVAFDRTVPLFPMLLASGFATLVVLFWMCVLNAMVDLLGPGWGTSLSLIGMLFSSPFAMYGMSSAAAFSMEWPLIALVGVVLAGAIYVSTEIVAGKEV